jgi:hypothetical protein
VSTRTDRLALSHRFPLQELCAAFKVLSDPLQRHVYDLQLLDQLDIEDYLSRFPGLMLTISGLDMRSSSEGSLGSFFEEGCGFEPRPGSFDVSSCSSDDSRRWFLTAA